MGRVASWGAADPGFLQNDNAVSVTLTVGDGHTHALTLSAAEVTQIAGGTRVSKESSSDGGHSHTVTFN